MMVAMQIAPEENVLVAEWKAQGKYTFPVLFVPAATPAQPDGWDYAFQHYGVWLAPTDLLLDAARKVLFRHVGATGTALEVEIRDLLGLPPFEGLESNGAPGPGSSDHW